jgi:hypothetical protein
MPPRYNDSSLVETRLTLFPEGAAMRLGLQGILKQPPSLALGATSTMVEASKATGARTMHA